MRFFCFFVILASIACSLGSCEKNDYSEASILQKSLVMHGDKDIIQIPGRRKEIDREKHTVICDMNYPNELCINIVTILPIRKCVNSLANSITINAPTTRNTKDIEFVVNGLTIDTLGSKIIVRWE